MGRRQHNRLTLWHPIVQTAYRDSGAAESICIMCLLRFEPSSWEESSICSTACESSWRNYDGWEDGQIKIGLSPLEAVAIKQFLSEVGVEMPCSVCRSDGLPSGGDPLEHARCRLYSAESWGSTSEVEAAERELNLAEKRLAKRRNEERVGAKKRKELARERKKQYLRDRRKDPQQADRDREYRSRPDVRDRNAARRQRRRAQELFGPGDIAFKPSQVYERDGGVCQLCDGPIDMTAEFPHPRSPSVDHIVALSKGGRHCFSNVQSAHLNCNLKKGDRAA
ncbi:HNH endonuclease [Rhodococcus phage MacGully]|nr:HNH endonuclease [Rhodococcus phage MacGully]